MTQSGSSSVSMLINAYKNFTSEMRAMLCTSLHCKGLSGKYYPMMIHITTLGAPKKCTCISFSLNNIYLYKKT